MLRHHTRTTLAALAPVLAAAPLLLATPSTAAGQTSWGVGVVVGNDQGRPSRPTVWGGMYWGRNNRGFQFAYTTGYTDGYEKGIEDARKWRSFDPARHRRYRSADHRYSRRYGPRVEYERAYRDGFRAGYRAGYQEARSYRGYPRGRGPVWRPY
jgi:hypothetical protein